MEVSGRDGKCWNKRSRPSLCSCRLKEQKWLAGFNDAVNDEQSFHVMIDADNPVGVFGLPGDAHRTIFLSVGIAPKVRVFLSVQDGCLYIFLGFPTSFQPIRRGAWAPRITS